MSFVREREWGLVSSKRVDDRSVIKQHVIVAGFCDNNYTYYALSQFNNNLVT